MGDELQHPLARQFDGGAAGFGGRAAEIPCAPGAPCLLSGLRRLWVGAREFGWAKLKDKVLVSGDNRGSTPLVSIVLPSYNHAPFVAASIRSVIAQDYQNIELLIVDDGSSDGSVEIIQSLVNDCQARFARFEFRSQPNQGLLPTLNDALRWMKGSYYTSMASDDVILAHKTSQQVAYLNQNPDVAAVFGGMEEIDEQDAPTGRVFAPPGRTYDFEDVAMKRCPAYAPAQLLRMEPLRAAGGFDESLAFEDWPMWLAMTHAGHSLATMPDVMVRYRRHDGNLSGRIQSLHDARVAALSKYRDQPSTSLALAQVYAGHAVQIYKNDPMGARAALREAVRQDKHVLGTKKFWRGLGRVLLAPRAKPAK